MFTRAFGLVLIAPLFCLGCSDAPVEPPDARQAQFVGMWREVYQGPKGIITLKEDGTYTAMVVSPFEQRVLFKAAGNNRYQRDVENDRRRDSFPHR